MEIGQTLVAIFPTTSLASGAAKDADSLPTAVLRKNGATVGGATVTVTNLSTGLYKASVLIDASHGWVVGDMYAVTASVTMETVAQVYPVAQGVIKTILGTPAGASISADIAGVQSDTDNIQTRLPAALVSGRMDVSVGAMAADVVTASAIATDAIDADAIKADAVTELQGGLADKTTLDAIKAKTDLIPAGGPPAASDYTSARAAKLDNLDAEVSSRATPEDFESAGDPLTNEVPGGYAQGTAGFVLGRLLPGQVNTINPVVTSDKVVIVQGDDYYSADGRSLDWIETGGGTVWPDLSGAVITFYVLGTSGSILTKAGSVVTPTGSSKKVRVQLTSAETRLIPPNTKLTFAVKALLANGHNPTLARGVLLAYEEVGQ